MDLFRQNQKLVFYILTPIIIIAFVVWGVGDFIGTGSYRDMEMGMVDGKSVSYQEYEAFRKRLQAALGSNIALQFNGQPYANTQIEDLWKYMFTYALLQDAEKAGARASDLQVGTYLESGHPNLSQEFKGDREALDLAVTRYCSQHQISRQEFLRGIREFQTMGNYVLDDANIAVVNEQAVYTFYAFGKGECVVKRIRILETDAIREQAKKDVMEKPAAELEAAVRAYTLGKANDRRYRNPSGWRFAYVFMPNASEGSVREASKAEIQDYYDNNKTSFDGKPLEEVEDEIKSILRRNEVERQTIRNFTIDVDPQLRKQSAELELSELVKLTPLLKYGVIGADTGPEPLSSAEVMKKLPEGADFMLRMMLEGFDDEPGSERDTFFDEWKAGYLLLGRPFKAEKGYFRLRLLDFQPSTPMAIEDEEGNIRPEILERAVADMIGDRADELVNQQASDMEQRLRAYFVTLERGEEPTDAALVEEFGELPSETITYLKLVEEDSELIRLSIGDIMGPLPYKDPETGTDGREIVALVERRLPTRATFRAESQEYKNRLTQNASLPYRGGLSFTYTTQGPTAVVQPGLTILASLWARYYQGRITVNPELVRARTSDSL